MVAVAIHDLSKRFGETEVLRGVNLEIPEGAFAVLVGPSGCGKSTLLRLIAGLERPSSGSIRFDEHEVSQLQPRERDVAMVFQSYALYPHLNVRENLGFGLTLRKTPATEVASRVQEVSEMLGLEQLLDRMPRALSGGQRQRVAMGRAIARRPQLFLFDEPLSNLDAALRGQVRVDIRSLHKRLATTSIYVTHDQVEAMTLADVMFVLNEGKVEQAGAPLELYNRPASAFVAAFLGMPPMNLLEAKVQREGDDWVAVFGKGESASVVFAEEKFGPLQPGQAVLFGVRPHDLKPGQAVSVETTYKEALGGETYVHGQLAGQAVVVRLEPSERVVVGEALGVQIDKHAVHLFDPSTGASLRTKA